MTSTTMTHPVCTPGAETPGATFSGIPFGRLVRVEWGKATDTRAARWLLIAVAATTVGLMLAPVFSPSSIDQSYTSYLGFAAVALSILLPVVSILTLTSEWSQRTALATFTQEPRRMRIVGVGDPLGGDTTGRGTPPDGAPRDQLTDDHEHAEDTVAGSRGSGDRVCRIARWAERTWTVRSSPAASGSPPPRRPCRRPWWSPHCETAGPD